MFGVKSLCDLFELGILYEDLMQGFGMEQKQEFGAGEAMVYNRSRSGAGALKFIVLY